MPWSIAAPHLNFAACIIVFALAQFVSYLEAGNWAQVSGVNSQSITIPYIPAVGNPHWKARFGQVSIVTVSKKKRKKKKKRSRKGRKSRSETRKEMLGDELYVYVPTECPAAAPSEPLFIHCLLPINGAFY